MYLPATKDNLATVFAAKKISTTETMSLNKCTKDMAAALHIRTYSPLKKPFPFHSMLRKLYD